MLSLTRRAGQSVFIGDDIVVTVISVHAGMVKLGFDAPKDVHILRDDAKIRERKD